MKYFLLLFVLFSLVCSVQAANKFQPFPQKNQHPLTLTTLYFQPDTTDVLAAGKSKVISQYCFSTIYTSEEAGGWQYIFDMEIHSFNFTWQYGLGSGWETKIELPLILFSQGFLDDFLINYHRFLALNDYGRPAAPRNSFQYVFKGPSGPNLVSPEVNVLSLGDIALFLKKKLYEKGKFGESAALQIGVKVPTGSAKKATGSGSYDYGIQLLWQKPLNSGQINFGLGRVFLGTYQGNFSQQLQPANLAFLQGAWPFWQPNLSVNFQLEYQSPILPNNNTYYLGSPTVQFSGGLNLALNQKDLLQVSFVEDLIGAAPDFSVILSFSRQL